jgi:DHA1 family tetracycline resistance protein-like MFS transporter
VTLVPAPVATGRDLAPVGAAMALAYTAQQSVLPALLPIAVRLGLGELRMGALVTVSGVAFLLSNPLWTHVVRRRPARPLLVAGLAGLVLCSIALTLLVDRPAGPLAANYALLVVARGVLFGLLLSAVVVSGSALVLAAVTGEHRGRAATVIAAAQGFGVFAGPLLTGVTSGYGLTAVLLVPLVPLAAVTVLVARTGRAEPPTRVPVPVPVPVPGSAVRPGRPAWPYLFVVVALLLAVAVTEVSAGFLVEDRLGWSSAAAGRTAAWLLVAGSVPFLLVQAAILTRPVLPAGVSLRIGLVLTLAGLAPLAFSPTLAGVVAGVVVSAAGIGAALPSCYELVSRAGPDVDQAQVAGAIAAAAGVAFAAGPALTGVLHLLGSPAPFLAAGALVLASSATLPRPRLTSRRTP